MKFKTTITHDDFKAFNKVAAQNSGVKSSGKSFFKNLAIWIVIGFVGIILVNLFKVKLIEFNYPTSIITAIAVLSVVFIFAKSNIKKMRPLDNGSIIGEHEYDFTDSEIIHKKGNHTAMSPYDSILNVVDTENNIFIFIDKIAAYLINKQNIASESSVEEIINHIKSKCKKN